MLERAVHCDEMLLLLLLLWPPPAGPGSGQSQVELVVCESPLSGL
jgi:hypothetical protein